MFWKATEKNEAGMPRACHPAWRHMSRPVYTLMSLLLSSASLRGRCQDFRPPDHKEPVINRVERRRSGWGWRAADPDISIRNLLCPRGSCVLQNFPKNKQGGDNLVQKWLPLFAAPFWAESAWGGGGGNCVDLQTNPGLRASWSTLSPTHTSLQEKCNSRWSELCHPGHAPGCLWELLSSH